MIAALYVDRALGPYEAMPSVDVWDATRNAKLYPGPWPVIAHPPCGPWSRLSHLCTKQDPECGPVAVAQVRAFGGILEHPADSKLWNHCNLPRPGDLPRDGLWALEVDQCRWGHKARKRTWLLFAQIAPSLVGPLPPWREPTHCVDDGAARRAGLPSKYARLRAHETHLTPPAFAQWLINIVRSA